VFTPSAGTINFAGNAGFSPLFVKAITNQTQNVFIYMPGIVNFGGSWDTTGTILTLKQNVSTHNASDLLLVQYDDQLHALRDQAAILSGQNVGTSLSYAGQRGAISTIPGVEDHLLRLIAEVRLLTTIFAMQVGNDVDLDAGIANILSNLKT
jgi:hypothetical protein